MYIHHVRNIHDALPSCLQLLGGDGLVRKNGVIAFPAPLTTVFQEPCERVSFHPHVDPFYRFQKGLSTLNDYARALVDVNATRVSLGGVEVYCTRTGAGAINMTAMYPKTDLLLCACWMDAVEMTFLHEYLAARSEGSVGKFWQIINNAGTLESTYSSYAQMVEKDKAINHYPTVKHFPMIRTPVNEWRQDLEMFLSEGMTIGIKDPFFRKVASPIFNAKKAVDKQNHTEALKIMGDCQASDWKLACENWIEAQL